MRDIKFRAWDKLVKILSALIFAIQWTIALIIFIGFLIAASVVAILIGASSVAIARTIVDLFI